MATEKPTTWRTYEQVSRYLLEKLSETLGLGLESVEGKQKVVGQSGTEWEIDGKGVRTDDGSIVVIECRRYPTSRLKQGQVAHLAYEIADIGASGAIIVTPIGLQRGAKLIAEHEGIQLVQLDADSTLTEGYLLRFLDTVRVGPGGATFTLTGGVPDIVVAPAEPNE